jgi:hydrogenase expression/formation protein HypC
MCLALPGQIVALDEATRGEVMPMGRVSFEGVEKEICLACVPEARVGDWVLVHVGMAISMIHEDEAQNLISTYAGEGDAS